MSTTCYQYFFIFCRLVAAVAACFVLLYLAGGEAGWLSHRFDGKVVRAY